MNNFNKNLKAWGWESKDEYNKMFLAKKIKDIISVSILSLTALVIGANMTISTFARTENTNNVCNQVNADLPKYPAYLITNMGEDNVCNGTEITEPTETLNEAVLEINEEIELALPNVITLICEVPNNITGCKSWKFTYMDYKAVKTKSSNQYKLLNSEDAHTDEVTGIRMINDRYAIAVGLGYGFVVGDYIDVVMENGAVIPCIMGDAKAPAHTDETQRFQKYDGSVVEMIIDGKYFKSSAQYPEELNGNVIELRGILKEE